MRITLAVLWLSVSATARADDLGYKCREVAPTTKLTVTFGPTVSLHDLSIWVLGFSCKNIVFSPEVAKHAQKVTVMAPKELSPKQALQLFVDAVESTGLVVQQKPDTIIVKLGPDMPKSCPDLAVAPSRPIPTKPVPEPEPPTVDVAKLIAAIKKIDDTHYEVPQATIDALLANPMEVGGGARVVPSMKDGKPAGLKLYAIRPTSLFAKIGLTNGDTVVTINGHDVTNAEKALEAYRKLRDATRIDIAIVRRGQPLTLVLTRK